MLGRKSVGFATNATILEHDLGWRESLGQGTGSQLITLPGVTGTPALTHVAYSPIPIIPARRRLLLKLGVDYAPTTMLGDYRHPASPTRRPRVLKKPRDSSIVDTTEHISPDSVYHLQSENDYSRVNSQSMAGLSLKLEDYRPPPPLTTDSTSPTSSSWSLPRGGSEPPSSPAGRHYESPISSPITPLDRKGYLDATGPYTNEDQRKVVSHKRSHDFPDCGLRTSVDQPSSVNYSNHVSETERRGFRGFISALLEKDKETLQENERGRSSHPDDVRIERIRWDMSRLVGFTTSTCVEDWDCVAAICKRANWSDSDAKDACKALRRDIKFGLPTVQLSASRLWAILMRKSAYFVTHTTNRKFLGVVENIALNSATSQVVRDRLIEVIGVSVYLLKGSRNIKPYQATWRKLRLQLKLNHSPEGLNIPPGDFWSLGPHEYASSLNTYSSSDFVQVDTASDEVVGVRDLNTTVPKHTPGMESSENKQPREGVGSEEVVNSEENIEYLFKECRATLNICRILADAFLHVTPRSVASDPLIQAFREKCIKLQVILSNQIGWATELADRARVERLLPSDPGPQTNTTLEEQLLQALVAANKELDNVFKTYDHLVQIAESGIDETNSPKEQSHLINISVPDFGEPFEWPYSTTCIPIDISSTVVGTPVEGAQVTSAPLLNCQGPVISRTTAIREVVAHLVAHGCRDLSSGLDLSSFEEFPSSHGGLSDVYEGQLLNGSKIAVKVLRVSVDSLSQDCKHLKHSARELHTWGRCAHPNVIQLLGLAVFRGRIGMVSPWMEHGSLPRYLERVPGVNRFDMCLQICEGLTYLHQSGIVHGDLKGANIVVSAGGTPVLTDFGNSLLLDPTLIFTYTTSSPSFTVRWTAPEIIKGEPLQHTKASDVYALGMTLYEIMTGKVPYHGKNEFNVIRLVTTKVLPERPDCMSAHKKEASKFWELLVWCWEDEPAVRPSAIVVTNIMRIITPISCTHS